jgi:2-dehydro-3-deoxygluconokinase
MEEAAKDTVALKLGASGALISTEKGRKHVPAHGVEAVDATGAGEPFDGTFLATLLKTDGPFAAAERAVVAAALTTTGIGGGCANPKS